MLRTHESGQDTTSPGPWGAEALPMGPEPFSGTEPAQPSPTLSSPPPGVLRASGRLVQAARIRAHATVLQLQERRLKAASHAGDVGVQHDRLSTHERRELERLFGRLAPSLIAPIDSGDPRGPNFRRIFADPLAEIGRRGGPQSPDEDRQLQDLYRLIWEGVAAGCLGFRQFVELLAAEGPKYAIDSPCYDVLFRTAGYAGSSTTIQLMHDNMGVERPGAGGPCLGYLRFVNDRASTRAVRDRARRSVELALDTLEGVPDGHAELASFAGGTAQFPSLLYSRTAKAPRVHLFDMDPRAIVFSLRRARSEGFRSRLSVHCGNLLSDRQFDVDRLGLRQRFVFGECQGLFDYLPDHLTGRDRAAGRSHSAFAVALRRLFSTIAPGGRLVIGNFATGHPNRYFMELSNWPLLLRDEDQLERSIHGALEDGFELDFERIPPGDTQILAILTRSQ